MKFQVLLLLFVLSLAQAAKNMKCFTCDNCKASVGRPTTCSPVDEECMKIVQGKTVVKRCSPKGGCGFGKVQRFARRTWLSFSKFFKNNSKDAIEPYCCDDDLCNTGLKTLPSFVILTLPLLFVAVFKL